MKIIACIILSFLATVSGFAQVEETFQSGSVFSVPASGATVILTNLSSAMTRSIRLDTNSPAGLLLMTLQPGYPATNTLTGPMLVNNVVQVVTNTASWVTFTNALAWVAGGGTTNLVGAGFLKLFPGEEYLFDLNLPFHGIVIGVSIGDGTSFATGVTRSGSKLR